MAPAGPVPPGANRLTRTRIFLARAAAVAGLLALAALAAPRAAAQTDVWTATLTPADFSGSLGCNNASVIATSKCSTATVLSDDDFTYDSTDYSVTVLFLTATAFTFTVDTDITAATNALTVVVGGTSLAFADAGSQTARTRTWFNPSFSWTAGTAVSIRITGPTPIVPPDWSLKPTGLAEGSQFRLLFLSSTKRDATATDIADYNTFVQDRAEAGHTDIQGYSAGFRAVGCTADTDARDNTSTTGTGVPIYWLGGTKVADDYADFYNGDWDDEANDKNESGTDAHDTALSVNHPYTGCQHNGTESSGTSRALGTSNVSVGIPNSSTSGEGPIGTNANFRVLASNTRPMYGLSAVFQVLVVAPSLTSAVVLADGNTIQLAFSEDLQSANLPPASAFTVTNGGTAVTVTGVAAGSTEDVLEITVSPLIGQGQAVVVAYADPTAGDDAKAIQDTVGNDTPDFTTGSGDIPAVTNNSALTNEVLASWGLTPAGLAVGTKFRLLFLSSTKRDALSSDIADYNTFVQDRAAAGHADIQAYSGGFGAIGCTGAVDARDNTSTTGTGVPIYWLDGTKVADDYADFYDGSWDDEVNDKNESGTDAHDTSQEDNYPMTGCMDDGTESFAGAPRPRSLGAPLGLVRIGRLNASGSVQDPIDGNDNARTNLTRPMYGLSAVFEVAGAANTPALGAPTITGTPTVGQTLTAVTSAIMDANGLNNVSYTYQWIRVATDNTETNIAMATANTYTLVTDDLGTTIKVKVSFTDDATNAETLTSVATAAVTADTTPPTLTSADVTSLGSGRVVVVTFDERLKRGPSGLVPATVLAAITVTVDGVDVALNPSSMTGTPDIALQLQSPIRQGQTVVITYTDPTAVDDANAIQDWSGNDAASFTTGVNRVPAVTNNSTVVPVAPGAPTGLTATASGTTQIDLSWTAPADNGGRVITGYKIEISPNGTDTWTTHLADTASPNTTYAHTGLAASTTRHYRVSAINTIGTGAASNVDDATTGAGTNTAPTASNGEVTATEDMDYPFTAANFNFSDTDAGAALSSVKITSLPASGTGTLEVDGTVIASINLPKAVTKVDIDASKLTYSPPADASGDDYATFQFKVNDGTDDSANASTMTINVTAVNDVATGAPTITGTPTVGETLTAVTTAIMDDDGLTTPGYTYQWIRVAADTTETNIASATASTYTLVTDDLGATIKVKVSFTDDASNAETLTSVATAVVAADTTPPTLTSATVQASGRHIHLRFSENIAVVSASEPAASDFMVTADGNTIMTTGISGAGPVTDTYRMLVASAIFQGQAVVVIYTDPTSANDTNAVQDLAGNDAADFTTGMNSVPVVTNNSTQNSPATGAPTITGTAQVGQTLTAVTTAIMDVNGLTTPGYTYQWIRVATDTTETNIATATASTYTLVTDDLGKTIKVKVSFTDDASNAETLTSVATAAVSAAPNTLATGAPTITGTPTVGETLTAVTTAIMDDDGLTTPGYTYQWIRVATDSTEMDIGSATASTYTLVTDDLGATIKVKVSFTDDANNAETLTSVATAAVTAAANSLATGQPAITGTAQVGETLTAVTTAIMDTNGLTTPGYTYQWIRVATDTTETNIGAATASTYTLVTDDLGTTIKVKVSFTDDANNAETLTSVATAAVTAAPAQSEITLVGNAGQPTGERQTASFQGAVDHAQQFTTGANALGYTLTKVEFLSKDAQSHTFSAQLCEANNTGEGAVPDPMNCQSLSTTSSFAENSVVVFTPPAGMTITLAASTRYVVVLSENNSSSAQVAIFATQADNQSGETGWTLANVFDWKQNGTTWMKQGLGRDALIMDVKGYATTGTGTNTLPTASNGEVTATEDTNYTFTAANFNFSDTDAGAALSSVKITSLPASGTGTLEVDGTVIASGDLPKAVTKVDIDASKLTYSPPADASGDDYATFQFKVNDGTDDSATASTMTIDVTAVNDAATGQPGITGTAQVGQLLTAAVGTIADPDGLPDPFLTDTNTSFQWVRVTSGTDDDISGETASTYTLATADEGKTIKVKVSFQDGGGGSEGPRTSVATAVVSAAPAQVEITLVGNAGQPSHERHTASFQGAVDHAQQFTTGPNAAGDTLTKVEFLSNDAQGHTFSAQLCEANNTGETAVPDPMNCQTLSTTSSFAQGSVVVFTPPAGMTITLAASTRYVVVLSENNTPSAVVDILSTQANNQNGEAGWTLADVFDWKQNGTTWMKQGSGRDALIMDVKGYATPPLLPPGAVSDVVVVPVPRSANSLTVSWSAPDNAGKPAITGYDVRHSEADENNWTTVRHDDAVSTTFIIGGLPNSHFDVQVRALNVDGAGPWSSTAEGVPQTGAERVYANHPLIPDDLGPRDSFRLLFITEDTTDATDTGIQDYHDLAASRVIGLIEPGGLVSDWGTITLGQAALVSTPGHDARLLTDTTWTSTDRGVPIYWLNGARVADDYADFYDGVWADEANPTNDIGEPHSLADPAPWTGTDHDGTELFDGAASRAVGQSSVSVGVPGSTASGAGPLTGGGTFASTEERPLYSLWHVLVIDENLRLVDNTNVLSRGDEDSDTRAAARAQLFTTGPHSSGYGIAHIQITNGSDNDEFLGAVALHTTDTNGKPDLTDGLHATLSPDADTYWVLTAPAGTVLKPTTTYALVFQGDSGTYPELWAIGADGETVAAEGWSIADALLYHDGTSWVENPDGRSLEMEIIGPRMETEAPALVSATVGAAGNAVALAFDENVDLPSDNADARTFLASLASAFAVTADGVGVAVSGLTASSADQLTLGLSGVILQGQAVTLTYTDPTAGDDAVALQDILGNETPTFTTGRDDVPAVINNSAITGGMTIVPEPPGGGGGVDPGDTTPGENNFPTADAGPDQSGVWEGALVMLDGSGSSHPEDEPLRYRWNQLSGQPVVLSSQNVVNPTFTAPQGLTADEVLSFRLLVTGPEGRFDSDTVTITVDPEAEPPPAEDWIYYFSHLAVGASWQTTITYINYSSEQVSCQTDFLSDQGTPLMVSFADRGTVISRTDVLPPGGSLHEETNVDLSTPLARGWARATCTGPVKASLLYRRRNSEGVPTGEAGVNATTVAASRFVTFAEKGEGRYGTGVAYANPSDTEAVITFRARDADGETLASVDETLLPNGHDAQNMVDLFDLTSFSGSLEVTSTAPIVSLSLNNEADPVFSSLPPGEVDAAAQGPQEMTTYYFTHLAVGASWQTTITYINYSLREVSCETDFISDFGSPLMVSFADRGTVISRSDVLPPGGSVHEETNVDLSTPLARGWARATCTGPLKASLLYRRRNSEGVPTGEAGVNATTVPASRFVTFAEKGEGRYGTGVAYANPSDTTTAFVTFTAKDADGETLASVDETLLPNGHDAQNMVDLFDLTSFSGSLEVTSTAPIVSLSLNNEADPVFSSLPPGELDDAAQ